MIRTPSDQARPGLGELPLTSYRKWAIALLTWIMAWTIIFSGLDFWTIKLYDVPHYSWFEDYRATVRYSATLISPASFALAENAYFIWMNVYDHKYDMHEWEWYTGNPVNPDGYYNFVWGNGRGGWMRFPMKEWYATWMLITFLWFAVVWLAFAGWRRRVARKGVSRRAVRDSYVQSV